MPDANVQLRGALTTHVDALLTRARPVLNSAAMHLKRKGPKHPYVRLVNREAEKLVKAIRAAVGGDVTALPGRAQKGAVDAAVRKAAPKVAKALRV